MNSSTKCTKATVSSFLLLLISSWIRLIVKLGKVGWRPGTDPSVNITKERQRLLEQCRRLPGEPKLKLRSQVGEVLVTFYNRVLHSPPDEDEDDADEYESEPDSSEEQEQKQRSTCRPVPLQYLYKIRNDGLEMIERKDLFDYLPKPEGNGSRKRINSSGNLRIMYVIILYYALSRGESRVDLRMNRLENSRHLSVPA